MAKIKKGTGKIEFFTNFDYIKSKYDSGLVVGTELYNLVKKERNITMSYKQFSIYFKEHLFNKDERFFYSGVKKDTPAPAKKIEKSDEQKPNSKSSKIKKIVSGDTEKKKFNPHTVEINKEDIL